MAMMNIREKQTRMGKIEMKKEMNDDAPLLVQLKNWVQIGNAMFPKRDG